MDLLVDLMSYWPRHEEHSSEVINVLFALVAALGVAIGYGIAKCEKQRSCYEKTD